ncbi:MAG TPA: succinate dehydrogenase, cytochrome b556 subunit [Burkholderiales bacterium]|jgi:succinate dehydrogenase / fumarate reductase cytochrome b subunit|nr:succinate dehydrogenase, cytochrome b556 subunit [Burkholderiales bacterium]
MTAAPRPKYLNLFEIRQPVPAVVSILHRVSGALLFLFAWALPWALQTLLQSPAGFDRVVSLLDHWLVKLLATSLLWAFLHHFFAGVRFLLLDLHVGVGLASARASSWAVLALSLLLTAAIGVALW